jgi:hypothetical protein
MPDVGNERLPLRPRLIPSSIPLGSELQFKVRGFYDGLGLNVKECKFTLHGRSILLEGLPNFRDYSHGEQGHKACVPRKGSHWYFRRTANLDLRLGLHSERPDSGLNTNRSVRP